jgi:hypothetical protein
MNNQKVRVIPAIIPVHIPIVLATIVPIVPNLAILPVLFP